MNQSVHSIEKVKGGWGFNHYPRLPWFCRKCLQSSACRHLSDTTSCYTKYFPSGPRGTRCINTVGTYVWLCCLTTDIKSLLSQNRQYFAQNKTCQMFQKRKWCEGAFISTMLTSTVWRIWCSQCFFSPLTSLQKLKSKANLSRYQCLYGKEWIWACCVSSTGSTGITSSWTNQQLMSHILCQCSISFMVTWNILCQAPKLDFEDSWGDRVFRQIGWKTSKKWGRQTGWTHKPDRKVDGQTDGERRTER